MSILRKRLRHLGILLTVFFGVTVCTAAFAPKEIQALASEIAEEFILKYDKNFIMEILPSVGSSIFVEPEAEGRLREAMGLTGSGMAEYRAQQGDSMSSVMPPVPQGFSAVEWYGSGLPVISSQAESYDGSDFPLDKLNDLIYYRCVLTPVYCNIILDMNGATMDREAMTEAEAALISRIENDGGYDSEPGKYRWTETQFNPSTGRYETPVMPFFSAQVVKKDQQVLYQWSDNRGNIREPGTEGILPLETAGDLILTPGFAMQEGAAVGAAGTFTLLANAGYVLGDGTWKLVGDEANTYAGGITFYVPSTGDYAFTQ